MKHLLLILLFPLVALGAPGVRVDFLPVDANPDAGALNPSLILILNATGEDGEPLAGQPIDIQRSASASRAGVRVYHESGRELTEVKIESVTTQDNDRNGRARNISIKLDPAAPAPDGDYLVSLQGVGGKPALTIVMPNGTVSSIAAKPSLKVTLKQADKDWVSKLSAFQPKVAVSGGSDGSLFDIHIRRAFLKVSGHTTSGAWLDLDASLTPDFDNANNPLYGKLRGEFSLIHQRPWPDRSPLDGEYILAAHGLYESDQNFDLATASAGVGLWLFINSSRIEGLSDALCLNGETEGQPFAFHFAYDHVFHSDTADSPAAADGNDRLRARFLWPVRIMNEFEMPFTGKKWTTDLELDATAVWDFKSGDIHPDLRATLAFTPVSEKAKNLSFTFTYANGEISPSFVDAHAFLAGLRYRF